MNATNRLPIPVTAAADSTVVVRKVQSKSEPGSSRAPVSIELAEHFFQHLFNSQQQPAALDVHLGFARI